MKPFRIFRPGKHTASCGTQVEFTEEDLKRAVQVYDPATYAAPFVIGHPKTEDRAYGWAQSLSYDDGYVVVHPDPQRLEPTFADMVKQGAFRNRSASWYMPDHPNNPAPGNLYPKHIGWLGAAPPALKGLGDVEFAAEEHPELVVEFGESDWSISSALSSSARLFRGIRDWLLTEKGVELADSLVPSYAIDDLETQARNVRDATVKSDQAMNPAPAYNESTTGTDDMNLTPAEIADLQARAARATELEGQVTRFTERETALAASERQALVASIERDLEPLVRAGKLLPVNRPHVAAFMASLDDGTPSFEFGEAKDGKPAPKVSPRQFMRSFLEAQPKQVDFSERGNPTAANSGAMTPAQLAEKATALRAKVKAETGRDISFTEATNRALAEAGGSVEDNTPTGATE